MLKRKRALKPFVVPSIIIMFCIMIALGSLSLAKSLEVSKEIASKNYIFVSNEILPNNSIPVLLEEENVIIKRPYSDEDIKIAKSFYDYKNDSNDQEKSIIYYQDTYIQNTGIDYSLTSEFDILAILKGTVISVTEDDIVGKIVKIKHSNDLISVYQAMSTVDVKIDDEVLQGQKLGTSGSNTINSDLGNHLHFELYSKNRLVNPEDFFDKKLGDL